jgi:hypothetical protein
MTSRKVPPKSRRRYWQDDVRLASTNDDELPTYGAPGHQGGSFGLAPYYWIPASRPGTVRLGFRGEEI